MGNLHVQRYCGILHARDKQMGITLPKGFSEISGLLVLETQS